jgi:hypothetical protein
VGENRPVDLSPSLAFSRRALTLTRYGMKERVSIKGVRPVGDGAFREMAKRLRLRIETA